MEALISYSSCSSFLLLTSPTNSKMKNISYRNQVTGEHSKSMADLRLIRNRRSITRIAAINEVSVPVAAAGSSQVDVTWQIVVGAIAGVIPFVVAGIEFSKRIRKCEECGGSGLVLREKECFRCPACGGFLP